MAVFDFNLVIEAIRCGSLKCLQELVKKYQRGGFREAFKGTVDQTQAVK
jgi:hypothetical protein